jgi:parallel beta-helix repeat protein
MANNYNKKLLSIFIILILTVFTFSLIKTIEFNKSNSTKQSLRVGASTNLSVKNITIDDSETGSEAHNWNWAVNQTWCSGNGTFSDPFIIQNITIDSNFTSDGLTIKNSQKFFRVINCTIKNNKLKYFAGIQLLNVTNGYIINNTFINNDQGINIDICSNITIYNNKFEVNSANSVHVVKSNNNTIRQNEISQGVYGIIINNNSDYNLILENYIERCIIAISINNRSDYNEIRNNNLLDNNRCTFEDENCIGNIFLNNNCSSNPGSFYQIIFYVIIYALLFAIPTVLINLYFRRKKAKKKKDEENHEDTGIFGI